MRLPNRTPLDPNDRLPPFGPIADVWQLRDVPDCYWRWFLEQEWCGEYPELVEYANYETFVASIT